MPGYCACRTVTFEMTARPLFTHCCHCRWCQRETGAAFALNALIEASEVRLRTGVPDMIDTPSESGAGQKIARCPACKVALWSVYAGSGAKFLFIRVGVLEDPGAFPPDVHIYTDSKQPWVVIPEGAPRFPEYYDRDRLWPKSSLERRQRALDAL